MLWIMPVSYSDLVATCEINLDVLGELLMSAPLIDKSDCEIFSQVTENVLNFKIENSNYGGAEI